MWRIGFPHSPDSLNSRIATSTNEETGAREDFAGAVA
jgi:hypothetical protein